MMKTISRIEAPIFGRGAFGGALDAAEKIAARFHSQVEVCFIRPAPPKLGEGEVKPVQARLFERIREEGDAAAIWAFARYNHWKATQSSPESHWHEISGRVDEVIARRGAMADLIVLQRSLDSPSIIDTSFEAAVFKAGRLAMVVDEILPTTYLDHVLVAWDQSPETIRAMSLSLPFLQAAKRVSIFIAEERVPDWELAGLAEFLRDKGIEVSVLKVNPATAFLDVAKDCDATLLVMGAYSQRRCREVLFGGATRQVLSRPGLPVLMAH